MMMIKMMRSALY